MSLVQEFKDFASKGNFIDLAVGVIIGGAFGKIVTAMVDKILMPPIGLLIGGVDFSQLRFILQASGSDGKGEVAIGYGELIQNLVNFLIIAWCLFIVIKGMNSLKRREQAAQVIAPSAPSDDVVLLREIRDLLKK